MDFMSLLVAKTQSSTNKLTFPEGGVEYFTSKHVSRGGGIFYFNMSGGEEYFTSKHIKNMSFFINKE
jgi:hypothetical protein